jgi:hypothetical protein
MTTAPTASLPKLLISSSDRVRDKFEGHVPYPRTDEAAERLKKVLNGEYESDLLSNRFLRSPEARQNCGTAKNL